MLLIDVFRMFLFSSQSSRIVCALFALFVITADLMADAVHDATDACASESQGGGCDSCPACFECALHSATALAAESGAVIVPELGVGASVGEATGQCVIGSFPTIDHPPQLS